jgi:solute carrier family 8 (sodium/calcium exchanger)
MALGSSAPEILLSVI